MLRKTIHRPWFATFLFTGMLAVESDAQWRSPTRVDGAGDATVGELEAWGNERYALYDNRRGGLWETYFRASHDGGLSWDMEYRVGDTQWPRFAAEGQLVVIAWGESGGGGGHGGGTPLPDRFWVDVSRDGGRSFTRTALNRPTLYDLGDYPAVAIDGMRVYVYWAEDGQRLLQVSDDGGQTWLATPRSIPVKVEHENLVAEGDTLHNLVVDGSSRLLTYRRSTNAGVSWTSTVLDTTTAASFTGGARLVAQGSRIAAQWISSRSNNSADLYFATSADGGATWSAPVRLNTTVAPLTARVISQDLALDQGRLLSVYEQRPSTGGTTDEIYSSTSTSGGATWSTPVRIHTTTPRLGGWMSDPRCALSGDRAVTVWLDRTLVFPDPYLVAATSLDGGSTWVENGDIGGGEVVWDAPLLASDPEGAAGVLFQRYGDFHLYSSSLHQPFLSVQGSYLPGQQVAYTIRHAPLAEDGSLALVLLSGTGSGAATGGIPFAPGRSLLLDFDTWTLFSLSAWVSLLATTPLSSGTASTPPVLMPPGISVGDVWAAALVFTPMGFGSRTDTLKAN